MTLITDQKKQSILYLAKPWLYEREPAPNEIQHNAGRINGTGGLACLQAGVA
jgi:hypothetical protein